MESVVVSIIACTTYAFLDFLNNYIIRQDHNYNPIYCIGMIVPMFLLISSIFHLFSKSLSKTIDGLTNGLNVVANGNTDITLEVEQGGIMKKAYEDFNKMVRELQSVQILRTDFVNNFSHEFKTPITSIKGFAELLQDSDISEEDRLLYSRIIAEESERLASLANNTIFLSKLDTQEVITEKKFYKLDAQLRDCIALLSAACENKQIDISADLVPIQFYGNENLMKQVWLNLLNNAIRYTPEHGTILVSLILEEGCACISVRDSGIGMTAETASHIFDKYYQGDVSRSSKGLGLGLSIVHRIVELCNGNITVDSTPGKGSVFTVRLPLKE